MIRSLLYVPANSDRFVARAHERSADAIILDLEDAVPPAEKENARGKLDQAVRSAGQNGATVFVRINAGESLMRADAEAAARAGAFGLFVPKVQDARTLQELGAILASVERTLPRDQVVMVPMLEDAGAVLDARAIAKATPRVHGLVLGGEDFATSVGGEPTPEVLHLPKLLVHLAAKAVGVQSYGLLRSVADYADHAAMEQSTRQARAFGFDGATCVHPAVVPILNAGFSATPAEIERARRMIAANEAAAAEGRGAFEFEGKMVDEPVVARARALLARLPD